jgi:hypothetical protein
MKRKIFGLFLGAGASFELGMPLVKTLTKEFKEFWSPPRLQNFNEEWKKQGNGYEDGIIDQITGLIEDPDLNYENILGNLQTKARQRENVFAKHHYNLYIKMLDILYMQLYQHQINSAASYQSTLQNFNGLGNFSCQSNVLWAFSLNHDVVFESIADHCGIKISDGFWPDKAIKIPISKTTQYLSADVLTENDLNIGNLNLLNTEQDTGINLIKLHGALDVFTFRDGLDLCRLRPVTDDKMGKILSLKIINDWINPMTTIGGVHVNNEIVYTDNKNEVQFLRKTLLSGAQKFKSRFSQTLPQKMLSQFATYLNHVTDLYVLGYSFGDFHVDTIIREWLEFSTGRTITIVGPAPHIPYFLIHLKPQISLINKVASEFFKSYE